MYTPIDEIDAEIFQVAMDYRNGRATRAQLDQAAYYLDKLLDRAAARVTVQHHQAQLDSNTPEQWAYASRQHREAVSNVRKLQELKTLIGASI